MLVEHTPEGPSGLLGGQDLSIAAWTFKTFNIVVPLYINRAVGIMRGGQLVGGAIFHDFNGYTTTFSYWTKSALTRNECATLARMALEDLKVERVTIHLPRNRRRWGKLLLKLGAKVEGTLWRFYGRSDASEHAAVQYVLFREELLRIAGITWRRKKMN